MSTAGASAAAAAAARARRDEEEMMTPYSPADLADGWEFKILRSQTGAFGNPERLRAALTEEAQAGWSLVEKFDSYRIRLKRPASARLNDVKLDFDAYRTNFGMNEGQFVALIIACVLGAMALLFALIFSMARNR